MWKAKARRWLRAGGLVLTCLAGVLVLLGLALVVLLHNERTATWTAARALKHVRLYPGAALSLDGLRVSRQGIEVRDIALLGGDGQSVAGIRASRAQVRWSDLLHGQVVIDSLQIVEPRLDLQRLLDGLSKRQASEPGEPRADPEPERKARLRVAHLVLRDGNLESSFRIRGRPVAFVTSNLDLDATDLRLGPGIELQVDSLRAHSTLGDASGPIVLQARGGVAAGQITLGSVRIDSPASHIELHGSAPIASGIQALIANLQLDLVARPLDGRDLAPFVTIPPGGGRIDAVIHVALQGAAPVHTSGVTHAATNVQWGAHRIPNLRLDVDWRDGRADLRMDSEIDGRRLGMRGTCRPFDATVPYDFEIEMPAGIAALRGDIVPADGPSWRITRGSVRRLDLSRFAAAVPATDLTLELVANGRGTKPDSLALQAAIDLGASRIGSLTVDSLHVRSDLQAGDLTFETHGGVCGTTLALTGETRPFDSDAALHATLRFARFDLARWFPDTRPTTDLQGSVTIEGTGLATTARRADARLVLGPSRVGDQALHGADLRLALAGADLTVDGAIDQSPEGGIEIAARGRPFDVQPLYTVRDLKFAAVNLATILQKPTWRTRLNGHASLEGRGRTPATATARARLDLDDSMLFAVAISAVHGDAGFQAGAADLDLDLEVPGGSGSVRGSGTLLGPDPTWQASAAIHSEDLARLFERELPPGSFAAELTVEGHGRDPVQGTGTLTGRGRLGEAQLDSLAAQVRLLDKILHVDSLTVRSNVVRLDGAGALQLPRALPPAGDSLYVAAEILDPAPLAFLFGKERKLGLARGQCAATVVGEPDAARFEAHATVRDLHFEALRAASIQLTAQGAVDAERRPQQLAVRAQFDTAQVGDFQIPTGIATATYDGSVAQLRAEVAADASTRLQLAAHGPLEKSGEATLDTLVLQTSSDHWDLERPVRVAYGSRLEVDRFELRTGNRSIRFDGVIDPHGEHRFEAHLDSLELAALSTFFGWKGYSGNLAGELKVDGAAAAPHAVGVVNLALRKDGTEIGALQSRFTQANGVLDLTARVTNPEQDSLVVAGRIPRRLPGLGGGQPAAGAAADAPLELRARADDFRLDALSVLFPASKVRDVHGQLWLDATVTGTRRSPHAKGEARLQAGAARLPLLGVTYHDVQLTAAMDGNRIHLEQLTAASGPGNVRLAGDLDLGTRALQIEAHLERFRAIYNRRLHVEASGDLAVKGTLAQPTVTGKLTLTDTDIDISSGASTGGQAVTLTAADLKMLEDNFGYRPRAERGSQKSLLEAVELGIVVEAGGNTWVRRRASPRLALEMSGSVDIRKKTSAPLETFGRLEVMPQRSYAEQLGRRFEVETGVLSLNGDPNKAQIDFTAKWELPSMESSQPEVTVQLAAKGTMDNLRLRFTSDPAMDETQILACLTTGKPPASAVGQASANTAGTSAGTAIALGQAAGAVEDIGASVGLDVLQVRDDGVRGATVVAGSYVNPKTYVGVRQSATFENQGTSSSSTGASTEVELEYMLMKWLVANFQGGVSDVRLMFRSRYSY